MTYTPLRELPPSAGWREGDVLVLFGELFGRGYANGIVEEARRAGMTIVGATVGRRDRDGVLRPLTDAERAEAEAKLGGRIVNVPLEAGFDLEPADGGPSPVDQLQGARPEAWESIAFDWGLVERSRAAGARRFEDGLEAFASELGALVSADAGVLFVHTMAGGFPRARVYMPLLTRVFRGRGDKFIPSEKFWATDLGRLWAASFDEVTARTFERLVRATEPFRTPGRRVRYVAYGYHGCEVLVGGAPTWQTYVPYLQGEAKLLLERCARAAWDDGVRCTVFNAPEIWSNSSSIFLGVEVALYPLVAAIRAAGAGAPQADDLLRRCAASLRAGASLDALLARADAYLGSPVVARDRDLARWPQHATREQMEAMLGASDELLAMSADPKNPLAAELSRPVLDSVGRLMFDVSWEPSQPVLWLGHDVVARRFVAPSRA
jgi:hypothetical protein